MKTVAALIEAFSDDIESMIASEVKMRIARAVVMMGGLGSHIESAKADAVVARRKGPIQLCPAPGCRARAAPVFGMLCTKHKGASKRTVKQWRDARRAKKAGR